MSDSVRGRVQIFGDVLALAKYCQKEWPSPTGHCVLARRALRHGPIPRRPDPSPDEINEAFKRATRC